jgi:hypothetical protein
MTRTKNSHGKYAYGTLRPIAQGRTGVIDLNLPDPEFLIPDDVIQTMPDPLCTGALFHATCGNDRLLAHFPVDRGNIHPGVAGLKILDTVLNETCLPIEEQSAYRAKVTGDWFWLTVSGSKTLVLSVQSVELEKYLPKEMESQAIA